MNAKENIYLEILCQNGIVDKITSNPKVLDVWNGPNSWDWSLPHVQSRILIIIDEKEYEAITR